ncbi:nuclear transport factor 2 family protein [Granulicella sp. L60]|jgi:hypothetical protein|uniref:nuclear transport factor 2 family protein n=1 Tax=Granulicella sp. L60 TaxID=1641866 RepID=UPI00131B15D6|nr:nuclear transport factor 2 family protein [Granulicella sp. L60]
MRSILLLLATVTIPAFASAQPASTPPAPIDVVKLEQHLWTTMAEGDFATVRSLFTPDFIQVDEHIQAFDSLLAHLKRCKLQTYDLLDLQVRILTPDSAATAYHVVSQFDCGTAAKPDPKSYDSNSVTIWVRQPGTEKWLVQAHTATPTKP